MSPCVGVPGCGWRARGPSGEHLWTRVGGLPAQAVRSLPGGAAHANPVFGECRLSGPLNPAGGRAAEPQEGAPAGRPASSVAQRTALAGRRCRGRQPQGVVPWKRRERLMCYPAAVRRATAWRQRPDAPGSWRASAGPAFPGRPWLAPCTCAASSQAARGPWRLWAAVARVPRTMGRYGSPP